MRYFLSFLIGIGLIVLVFILILRSFNSGTKSTPTPLVSYANANTTVQLTIDGPINANQTHYQAQMSVGQDSSQLQLMKGYDGSVAQSATYANNANSYAEFLRALDLAGFSKGNTSKTVADERGACPTGNRYIYQIYNGAQMIQRFWSTSCGNQGSFKGNTVAVNNLFIAQMPDYVKFTNNTDL